MAMNQRQDSQSLEHAMDGKALVEWWQHRPMSDAERSERSERFFWARVLAILGVAAMVATLGVVQVSKSSAGILTAYKLVQTNDAVREQIEANRRTEAALTGRKNPNELRAEAAKTGMHVPTAEEVVEVE